jgi:hypothetical protein
MIRISLRTADAHTLCHHGANTMMFDYPHKARPKYHHQAETFCHTIPLGKNPPRYMWMQKLWFGSKLTRPDLKTGNKCVRQGKKNQATTLLSRAVKDLSTILHVPLTTIDANDLVIATSVNTRARLHSSADPRSRRHIITRPPPGKFTRSSGRDTGTQGLLLARLLLASCCCPGWSLSRRGGGGLDDVAY